MATRRFSADAVVSYFNEDEDGVPEMFFVGSDDDLGMEDELSDEEDPGCNGENKTIKDRKAIIHSNTAAEEQLPVTTAALVQFLDTTAVQVQLPEPMDCTEAEPNSLVECERKTS